MHKQLLERLNYLSLLGLVATFPFGIKINNLFLILFAITWLFQFRFSIRNNLILYCLGALYFFHVLGVLYSVNVEQALFELEKKIGLVLFPLIFSNLNNIDSKKYRTVLLVFVVTCCIALLILFSHATYQYINSHTTDFFFYDSLTDFIGIQPMYLSMYVCFSIFILVYLISVIEVRNLSLKILYIVVFGFLIVSMFFLSARIVILSFCLISFFGIMIYFTRRKEIKKGIGIISLMVLVVFSLIYFIPTNRERFKEAINYKGEYSIDKQWGGRSLRLLKWDCSVYIIKNNLLFGVGTGDAQDELQKCYETKLYTPLLFWPDVKFNAHNQYLQSAIDLGLVGLSLFLLCLIVQVHRALLNKNYLFISFIALFSICCLTESMLERNKGIVFFAFFASLFMYQNKQANK